MAHIHELIDWTAGAYIVHKNKVLLRKHDKYGILIHVGGHIELNEHPIEAAVREVFEEVGLMINVPGYTGMKAADTPGRTTADEVVPLPVPNHMNIHHINEVHKHVDLIYYATSETDEVTPEKPTDEWLWLTAEEVENHPQISPTVKEYALGALNALGS